MNPFVILLGGSDALLARETFLTLYTNCPLVSRPPVNHRSG